MGVFFNLLEEKVPGVQSLTEGNGVCMFLLIEFRQLRE